MSAIGVETALVIKEDLPQGTTLYGSWSGYVVKVPITPTMHWEIKTDKGIRGTCPVKVIVNSSGLVSVQGV